MPLSGSVVVRAMLCLNMEWPIKSFLRSLFIAEHPTTTQSSLFLRKLSVSLYIHVRIEWKECGTSSAILEFMWDTYLCIFYMFNVLK